VSREKRHYPFRIPFLSIVLKLFIVQISENLGRWEKDGMMAAINGSEINGNLSTEHEGVRNPAGTARPEDILQVGLDVERALEQSQAVSQL
jgi:hypothetical protein